MPKVIEITPQAPGFQAPAGALGQRRPAHVKTTADCRRLLSDMRLRPPSQRAFLRRLLKRATLTGVPIAFPVPIPAVSP